jgi:RHS repeat-associated protein
VTHSKGGINQADFDYGYNAVGSILQIAELAQTRDFTVTDRNTKTTTFTYDTENRLERIDFAGGGFAEYRYDGLSRRIQKNVNGTVTRYVYEQEDILREYDGTNTIQARYAHGSGIDEPLIVERDLDSSGTFEASERFFYHADGLGSITEITDQNGVVVRAYLYDSFGQIADEIGTLATPYAYTGREFDGESGLYYYRARYYDPAIGRFIRQDPIGLSGGINTYLYVLANPITNTDPSGLFLPGHHVRMTRPTGSWRTIASATSMT